jgi:peptidyl-tRNA hydrolase, PTH1 family
MGLLQRKPLVGTNLPLYTIGSNKSLIVIGMGNPGSKYNGTRHNVGFAVLDQFAKSHDSSPWVDKKDLNGQISTLNMGVSRVILIKPTTFMNNSGLAAQAIQHFFKVYNKQTLAVYDELAIPFGQIRTRVGGQDAGHNGVKSLIAHIGEDFGRLRVGVGSDLATKKDAADFVLSKFSKEEQGSMALVLGEASALISEFIFSGELPHDTRVVL